MYNIKIFDTKSDFDAASLVYSNLSQVKSEGYVYASPYKGYHYSLDDYVDLGINKTLWKKYNIGANKETEAGLYFQWGDIVGYSGDGALAHSTWSTCPGNGGYDEYTSSSIKCFDSMFVYKDKLERMPLYCFIMPSDYEIRMPSTTDIDNLFNDTSHEWTTIDGVNGIKFSNKSDASKYIFIPAAGMISNGTLSDNATKTKIWTYNRVSEEKMYYAYNMIASSDNTSTIKEENYRYFSMPIRQICYHVTID